MGQHRPSKFSLHHKLIPRQQFRRFLEFLQLVLWIISRSFLPYFQRQSPKVLFSFISVRMLSRSATRSTLSIQYISGKDFLLVHSEIDIVTSCWLMMIMLRNVPSVCENLYFYIYREDLSVSILDTFMISKRSDHLNVTAISYAKEKLRHMARIIAGIALYVWYECRARWFLWLFCILSLSLFSKTIAIAVPWYLYIDIHGRDINMCGSFIAWFAMNRRYVASNAVANITIFIAHI